MQEKELAHQWWKVAFDDLKPILDEPYPLMKRYDDDEQTLHTKSAMFDDDDLQSCARPPYQQHFPSFMGAEMHTSAKSNLGLSLYIHFHSLCIATYYVDSLKSLTKTRKECCPHMEDIQSYIHIMVNV